MAKIAHLTSVHPRNDTRIFIKQCRSLAAHDYDITLIVADNKGEEYRDNVKIVDAGRLPGRINRILRTTQQVFSKAVDLNADLYHLHDPELIPMGLKLRCLAKKVIFDSHEDVPADIRDKQYINPLVRFVISKIYEIYERRACSQFDAIIAATPYIKDKFLMINANSVDINNYPILGELNLYNINDWSQKELQVCYIGGISVLRGVREIIHALELTTSKVRLQIAGEFDAPDLKEEVKKYSGWKLADDLGFVNRDGVKMILSRCMVGLVTFHPLLNHISAQPNKMFEYMSAGIPVIASNFPLWSEIIEGNDCGLCVDPLDPKAIANAIDFIIMNPDRARQMGENGLKAVQKYYNWDIEEAKLLRLYEQVLGVS